MTIIATGPRVRLVAPSAEHVDPLASHWSDAETMRYIGAGETWSPGFVREKIERQMQIFERTGMAFYIVERLEDGAVLGQAGVVPIEFAGPEIELGYRLGRAHWGKGYATEAARLAMEHALGPLGVERLVAVTYPENTPSRRVLAKLGFREVGESDLYYGVRSLLHEKTR